MRAPAFWWRPAGVTATLLRPLAAVYGRIAARRMTRKPTESVAIPVICVGNLVAGGAGKTPTVASLIEAARADGETPVVLSRGYGGRLSGPLRVDPDGHTAEDVGDEPLMMARAGMPVVVSRDRPAGAGFAAAGGASLVIMDDGFQNPSLYKDLSILVVDRERGLGNGFCLPAGPVRAQLATQLEMADFLVLTGRGRAADAVSTAATDRGIPVIGVRMEAASGVAALAGKRVLAFAGIANPAKFFATLRDAGYEVVEARAFADHHAYSETDCRAISDACAATGLVPVTTAKDRVRLSGGPERARLAALVHVHEVRLVAEEPGAFARMIVAARAAFEARGASRTAR